MGGGYERVASAEQARGRLGVASEQRHEPRLVQNRNA